MWIWQTIKSILNYLYNHLIDLVWVKKIKFEDGTEMTTAGGSGGVGANLYDIKLLSQAIADKGWACLSHISRKDIAKNDVPTLYNDILNKYDNVNVYMSSFTQGNSCAPSSQIVYSNGKWFVVQSGLLFYTTNLQTPLIQITSSYSFYDNIFAGNNIIVCPAQKDGTNYLVIYDSSDITKVKTITYNAVANTVKRVILENDYIYFVPRSVIGTKIYKIKDDYDTVSQVEEVKDFGAQLYDLYKDENNYYAMVHHSNIQKSNSIDGTYTTIYTETDYSPFEQNAFILAKGNFICYACGSNILLKYTYNNFSSVSEIPWMSSDTCHANFTPVIFDDKVFYQTYDYDLSQHFLIYSSISNITTQTKLTTFYDSSAIAFSNNQIAVTSYDYIYYAGLIKQVYTDKIEIGNSVVSVNYYLKDSFKICISDGGTNDTNIETFYNYLGYENYFILDTINETITLPRNSNLWSMMYVGDNYQDSNLPTGTFQNLLTVCEEIINSNASVTLALKANKYYKLTNSAITDITLSSCEDSQIETKIKFTTGNSAPTLTDNSGLTWADSIPVLSANKTYLIVIIDKTAYYKEY